MVNKNANLRLFRIWYNMKNRCFNKNDKEKYKNYGGRGITMCDEWKNDFMSFYNWSMSNGYANNLSIDRIENNGNYEPQNCKWSTHKEQCRNRRSTKFYDYNGQKMTLGEISIITGIKRTTIFERMRINNINLNQALNFKKGKKHE